jgi:hypothetical protein
VRDDYEDHVGVEALQYPLDIATRRTGLFYRNNFDTKAVLKNGFQFTSRANRRAFSAQ